MVGSRVGGSRGGGLRVTGSSGGRGPRVVGLREWWGSRSA